MPRLQITLYRRADDGRFFAQLDRGDRAQAVTDQTYADLGDLLEAVFAFKRHAEDAAVNDRSDGGPAQIDDYEFEVAVGAGSGDGGPDGFVWAYQAPNGRVLFMSAPERFRTAEAAADAAEAARRFADACVVDETGEPVDVELYAGTGYPAPHGARYRVRVDRDRVLLDEPTPTGTEVLEAAGREPARQWQLYLKRRGGRREAVGHAETVDLTGPGVERFESVELTLVDGDPRGDGADA